MSVAAQTFVPEQTVLVRAAAFDLASKGVVAQPKVDAALGRLTTVLRRLYAVSLLWGAGVTAVVAAIMHPSVIRLITPDAAVSGLLPRAPLIIISLTIAPMLLSEGAMLGFAARLTLMRILLACCATSVAAGFWLTSRAAFTVTSIWWVAALFTILRLIGNAAFVARESLTADLWCQSAEGITSGLCELGDEEPTILTNASGTP